MVKVMASDPRHAELDRLMTLYCYAKNPHLAGVVVDLPEVEIEAVAETIKGILKEYMESEDFNGA